MKSEANEYNKKRFFAQHLFAKVQVRNSIQIQGLAASKIIIGTLTGVQEKSEYPSVKVEEPGCMDIEANVPCSIIKKAFHNIEKEHAIEIAKMCPSFYQTGEYDVFKNSFGKTVVTSGEGLNTSFKYLIDEEKITPLMYQYLQAQGYALNWEGITVKKQLADKWITFISDNNV